MQWQEDKLASYIYIIYKVVDWVSDTSQFDTNSTVKLFKNRIQDQQIYIIKPYTPLIII